MPAFESSAALLRRTRLLLVAGLAPLLLGALSFFWGLTASTEETKAVGLTVGLISTLVGVVTSVYVVRASPRKVAIPGMLSADDEGLRFADRLLARRRSLRAGFLIPTWGKPPLVRIQRRWPRRPLELELGDEATGRALLR